MVQRLRGQVGPQRGGDLCPQGGEDGLRIRWPQLREDDPESRVLLVPAGDVGLSDRGDDGGDRLVERAHPVTVVGWSPLHEQHQYKGLSRALGSTVSAIVASIRETDVAGWYK